MWFLRPSRDISLLKQRQKAVSYFMNFRNSEFVASLQDCLKHIKNVSVSMGKIAVRNELESSVPKEVFNWLMYVYVHFRHPLSSGNQCRYQLFIDILSASGTTFVQHLDWLSDWMIDCWHIQSKSWLTLDQQWIDSWSIVGRVSTDNQHPITCLLKLVNSWLTGNQSVDRVPT